MWKSKVYKWHKIIGITTAIPVFFWCLSGLMHPFMAHWFKPEIPNSYLEKPVLDTNQFNRSLKEVLEQNKLSTLYNAHTVMIGDKGYYQVEKSPEEWMYINANTGKIWKDGDREYAIQLARYFLNDASSKITHIQRQTSFDQSYKYINRLLPVWKISFDRPDGMEVYVESSYSRLATYNTTARKVFLTVFDLFHNWGFLGYISNNTIRILVMLFFLGIITLSAISGVLVYGFMWKRFAPVQKDKPLTRFRKYHRSIGISVALVTFTFAFSGGYHALTKWEPNTLPEQIVRNVITTKSLGDQIPVTIPSKNCVSIAVVTFNGTVYEQRSFVQPDYSETKRYFDAKTGHELIDGEKIYAQAISQELNLLPKMGNPEQLLTGYDVVSAFENREYGFANKRLPVVRLRYATGDHLTNYIETSTGRLAASISDADRYEGYSFAILHKFLLLDWAGKNVRDGATLVAALGVLMACFFGLMLFFKKN